VIYVHDHLIGHGDRLLAGGFILIPPICGLRDPVGSGFRRLARALAERGHTVTTLDFAGQNGNPGRFSVRNSGVCLADYLANEVEPVRVLLFGVCSGALAALYAAASCSAIGGVFCWELSPWYQYARSTALALSHMFALRIDWDNALDAIQPQELLARVSQPVVLGWSDVSGVTTLAEQCALASVAPRARTRFVEGVGHMVFDAPRSDSLLVEALADLAAGREQLAF
jgi:hypothetical protein